jgi:hypothetical protein
VRMKTPALAAPEETLGSNTKFYGVSAIISIILITGFWLIIKFSEADLSRDTLAWEEKMNLIAESRASETTNWISAHFKNLRSLASNPSLQLYLTELESDSSEPRRHEPAAKAYLRNLLIFTADQTGFSTPVNSLVNANLQPENKNGLAVLDKNGNIVASTSMSPAMSELITGLAKNITPTQESLIDMQPRRQVC